MHKLGQRSADRTDTAIVHRVQKQNVILVFGLGYALLGQVRVNKGTGHGGFPASRGAEEHEMGWMVNVLFEKVRDVVLAYERVHDVLEQKRGAWFRPELNILLKYSMKGGGSWEEYCALCDLPLTMGTTDYEFKDVDVKWLNDNVGFEKETSLRFDLGKYDDNGVVAFATKQSSRKAAARIKETGAYGFTMHTIDEEHEGNIAGPVFHRACLKVAEATVGHTLSATEAVELMETPAGEAHSKYHDQYFQWEQALEDNGEEFFASPLVSKDAMARILPTIQQFQSKYKKLEARKGKKRQTARSPCLPGQTRNRTSKACRDKKKPGRKAKATA